MKDGFPDIVNRADFVMSIIKDEEFAFNKTLGKGRAASGRAPQGL